MDNFDYTQLAPGKERVYHIGMNLDAGACGSQSKGCPLDTLKAVQNAIKGGHVRPHIRFVKKVNGGLSVFEYLVVGRERPMRNPSLSVVADNELWD